MNYWLVKTEPSTYSIDDLAKQKNKIDYWDGVRNYQARNFLRDQMKKDDLVLFYHSNTKPPGIVGLAKIVREGYPDFTAFDPNSKYYDPKSSLENPRWFMVDIQLIQKFHSIIALEEIKNNPKLQNMKLVQRGQRLSIQPVAPDEFSEIIQMAENFK